MVLCTMKGNYECESQKHSTAKIMIMTGLKGLYSAECISLVKRSIPQIDFQTSFMWLLKAR